MSAASGEALAVTLEARGARLLVYGATSCYLFLWPLAQEAFLEVVTGPPSFASCNGLSYDKSQQSCCGGRHAFATCTLGFGPVQGRSTL